MTLFVYVKTTLKTMISSMVVLLATYLFIPIFISFVMGFLNDGGENTLKYDVTTIKIVDNDESNSSKELVDFIKSDNLKEIIKVSDKDKIDTTLIIPKGYEDSLAHGKNNNIEILDNEQEVTINILKEVLDLYHKNYLFKLEGGQENIDIIDSSVVSEIIDGKKDSSSYEIMATNMLGFVVVMILYTTIYAIYTDINKNMDNRINAMPISKSRLFIYDSISSIILNFFILLGYILFFKCLGIAFFGEVIPLVLITLITGIFINSFCSFVANIFSEKIGKVIGLVFMMLPIFAGEIFGVESNVLSMFTPSHYICKMFKNYSVYGGLNNSKIIILSLIGISIILYLLTLLRINTRKEAKR